MNISFNRHFKIIILLLFLNSAGAFFCNPTRCGFAVSTLYKASFFDGRMITGRSIVIAPLLKEGGTESSGLLAINKQIEKIGKMRNDLKCVSFNNSALKIKERYGENNLHIFLSNLYKGDIPVIQTSDSLWNIISEDYMAVIRMKKAHTIKTFSGDTRKRIMLEGELWDCRNAEAVFRVVVNGICLTDDVRDDKFIMDGILAIYHELPATSPAYDTDKW